ncbi:MAG: MFS transporter [Gammaproteobacteria bacterium SHHR-1]|uniref:MFS transporter n=1 Tax=Magnetovirga frankeli TaxID=947516 RepID=UPI001293EB5F|nr:MFS transporter [gamma proteobacterium SS-5]
MPIRTLPDKGLWRIQLLVFCLVVAAFSNIYITQPVLPVLVREFGVDAATASLSVSAVILGIALANLPFGRLSDHYALRPLILIAAFMAALADLVCALTQSFQLLVAARFLQGLFIPALTTCVAAYLANALPLQRLNVAMGAYVSATVVGGLGGRLLGGFLHPPLHWRYAFFSAAGLLLVTSLAAARWLPGVARRPQQHQGQLGFAGLLRSWPALRLFLVGFGAFWVFSATFNFLPFHLSEPPISASTGLITGLYTAYLIGALMGPLSGRLANRFGSPLTLVLGSLLFGLSLAGLAAPNLALVILALLGSCAGFFTIHAAANGALNGRLSGSRGRGNALYVLFYYVGGALGITVSGYLWRYGGWDLVLGVNASVLSIPLLIGLYELKRQP